MKKNFNLFTDKLFLNKKWSNVNGKIAQRITFESLMAATFFAQKYSVPTGNVLILTILESGHNPKAVSPGTKATGMNQITRDNKRVDYKTLFNGKEKIRVNISDLSLFSALQQFEVMDYFYLSNNHAGQHKNLLELYLDTFVPAAVGQPFTYIMGGKANGAQYKKANSFFTDRNSDGLISKEEVDFSLKNFIKERGYDNILDAEPSEEYVKSLFARDFPDKGVSYFEQLYTGVVLKTLPDEYYSMRKFVLDSLQWYNQDLTNLGVDIRNNIVQGKISKLDLHLHSIPGYALMSETGEQLLEAAKVPNQKGGITPASLNLVLTKLNSNKRLFEMGKRLGI